jgi:hypothetical protein
MWIGVVLMPIQIFIGIKTEVRIRIKIGNKTMPFHNTAGWRTW